LLYAVLTLKFPSLLDIICHKKFHCICHGRNELKREGSGRGNWGTPADEIAP